MKFGKIFEQMYDSSIANDWEAMVTFQQLIIMCSYPEGVVDMTASAIARRCGIPFEHIQRGLEILKNPDPESRSKDEEGRRIVPLLDADGQPRPWGWKIVNYDKYRKKMAEQERREYQSAWQREKRAREKASSPVDGVSSDDAPSSGVDSDDTGEKIEIKRREDMAELKLDQVPLPLEEPEKSNGKGTGFDAFWHAYPKKEKKEAAQHAWGKLCVSDRIRAMERLRPWMDAHPERQFQPLAASWLNGKRWQDELTSATAKSVTLPSHEENKRRLALASGLE